MFIHTEVVFVFVIVPFVLVLILLFVLGLGLFGHLLRVDELSIDVDVFDFSDLEGDGGQCAG